MKAAVRLGLVVLVALALSPVSGTSAAPTKVNVKAAGGPAAILWSWDPESIEVEQHGRVVWTNPTSVEHHVAAVGGGWTIDKHLPADGRVVKRFSKPGTYTYRCTLEFHSVMVGDECVGMCGEIVVVPHKKHHH